MGCKIAQAIDRCVGGRVVMQRDVDTIRIVDRWLHRQITNHVYAFGTPHNPFATKFFITAIDGKQHLFLRSARSSTIRLKLRCQIIEADKSVIFFAQIKEFCGFRRHRFEMAIEFRDRQGKVIDVVADIDVVHRAARRHFLPVG